MTLNYSVEQVIRIAKKAGEGILKIYNDPSLSAEVDIKADDSPLTLADKASHEIIMKDLRSMSDYPIMSEESDPGDYIKRKDWETYWLVDPLDGTKEFIKRNGEFTVNIALIHNRKPVLGVVYVPVSDTLYVGDDSLGAFKMIGESKAKITVNKSQAKRIAVRSKSHASVEEEEVLGRYDVAGTISKGSSLKFCMVAEGKADIYYRHGPTMEWDTGAGQAVLLAAGGRMYHGNTEENHFKYNKEDLLNGSFLCLGF
jgi:3'(2'), 5'-bisphosphate nucleotidase